MDRRPQYTEKNDSWPEGVYSEKRWVNVTPDDISYQVGDTCLYHALVDVTEARYAIYYASVGIPVPFDRLSVQHSIDEAYRFKKILASGPFFSVQRPPSKKDYALAVMKNGILAVKDYSASGRRGELQWKPPKLPENLPRYPVCVDCLDSVYDIERMHQHIEGKLEKGPVYADFVISVPDYNRVKDQVIPHTALRLRIDQRYMVDDKNISTHSACIVGKGTFTPNEGPDIPYYVYLNSYGNDWGDAGYGRIECRWVSTVWILTVPSLVAHLNIDQTPSSSIPRPSLTDSSPSYSSLSSSSGGLSPTEHSTGTESQFEEQSEAHDSKRRRDVSCGFPDDYPTCAALLSEYEKVRDADLLIRAVLALSAVDVDEYAVRYSIALELIELLQAMGESIALLSRSRILKRETAMAKAAIYESMFAAKDGNTPATFQQTWSKECSKEGIIVIEAPRQSDLMIELIKSLRPQVVSTRMAQFEDGTSSALEHILGTAKGIRAHLFLDISDQFKLSNLPSLNRVLKYLAGKQLHSHAAMICGLLKNKVYSDQEVAFAILGERTAYHALSKTVELLQGTTALISQYHYGCLFHKQLSFQLADRHQAVERGSEGAKASEMIGFSSSAISVLSYSVLISSSDNSSATHMDVDQIFLPIPTSVKAAIFESFAREIVTKSEINVTPSIQKFNKSNYGFSTDSNSEFLCADYPVVLFYKLVLRCIQVGRSPCLPIGTLGNYVSAAKLMNANIVNIPTNSEGGFKLMEKVLTEVIGTVSKLWVYFSGPTVNPTGLIYCNKGMESILSVCAKFGAQVSTDISFSGVKYTSNGWGSWDLERCLSNLTSSDPSFSVSVSGGLFFTMLTGGLLFAFLVLNQPYLVDTSHSFPAVSNPHGTIKYTIIKLLDLREQKAEDILMAIAEPGKLLEGILKRLKEVYIRDRKGIIFVSSEIMYDKSLDKEDVMEYASSFSPILIRDTAQLATYEEKQKNGGQVGDRTFLKTSGNFWNICAKEDKLWIKRCNTYIRKRKRKNFWSSKCPAQCSRTWMKHLKSRPFARRSNIGNGRGTGLWRENWHHMSPLIRRYGRRLAYDTNVGEEAAVHTDRRYGEASEMIGFSSSAISFLSYSELSISNSDDSSPIHMDVDQIFLPLPTPVKAAMFESYTSVFVTESEIDVTPSIQQFNKSNYGFSTDSNSEFLCADYPVVLFNKLVLCCIQEGRSLCLLTSTHGNYVSAAKLMKANMVNIPTNSEVGFKLTEKVLTEVIGTVSKPWVYTSGPRVKPTGLIYCNKEMESILSVCAKFGARVVTGISFSGVEYNSDGCGSWDLERCLSKMTSYCNKEMESILSVCAKFGARVVTDISFSGVEYNSDGWGSWDLARCLSKMTSSDPYFSADMHGGLFFKMLRGELLFAFLVLHLPYLVDAFYCFPALCKPNSTIKKLLDLREQKAGNILTAIAELAKLLGSILKHSKEISNLKNPLGWEEEEWEAVVRNHNQGKRILRVFWSKIVGYLLKDQVLLKFCSDLCITQNTQCTSDCETDRTYSE